MLAGPLMSEVKFKIRSVFEIFGWELPHLIKYMSLSPSVIHLFSTTKRISVGHVKVKGHSEDGGLWAASSQ